MKNKKGFFSRLFKR